MIANQEQDALKFWEGMFGNAISATAGCFAGSFTINYKDFIERYNAHIQTTVEEAKIEGFLAGRNIHASELTQLDIDEAILANKIHPDMYYTGWMKKLGLSAQLLDRGEK